MSIEIVALASGGTLIPMKYIETLTINEDEEALVKSRLADDFDIHVRTLSGAEYVVTTREMHDTIQELEPNETFTGEEVRNVIVHLWMNSLNKKQ